MIKIFDPSLNSTSSPVLAGYNLEICLLFKYRMVPFMHIQNTLDVFNNE